MTSGIPSIQEALRCRAENKTFESEMPEIQLGHFEVPQSVVRQSPNIAHGKESIYVCEVATLGIEG
jgi:hypothetical protein